MFKTFVVVAFAALFLGVIAFARPVTDTSQDELAAFKGNSCVECHSRDLKFEGMTNHYLEWHLSRHMQMAVSCDKCHGGDPTTDRKDKSHVGVLKSEEAQSKTNSLNLPQTCGSCHEPITTAFTGSTHYQKLKAAGLGPTCATCHQHMASTVASFPPEAANLCAQCHGIERNVLPKRDDIQAGALTAMEAIDRANGIVVWATGLMDAAKERKVNVAAEEADLAAVKTMLADSKAKWHTFTLVGVRETADAAFAKGVIVKDKLRTKLGFK